MNESKNKPDLPQVAVFDVCDTLYYSNTTHDFIDFVARQKFSGAKRLSHRALNSRKSPLRYALILTSIATGRDLHKKFNVSLLKGIRRAELDELARQFIKEYLNTRKIKQTHAMLDELRLDGTRIVLCSSSIEPVVRQIAAELEIKDFVCTTLEFSGDVFTGRIAREIADRKNEALKNETLSGEIDWAVSDNKGDAGLLATALTRRIAVVHNQKNLEFWKQHQVEILDLRQ